MHCINHNVGDKPLVVICNVDTKPQGIPCLFSSDNLPAKRCNAIAKADSNSCLDSQTYDGGSQIAAVLFAKNGRNIEV